MPVTDLSPDRPREGGETGRGIWSRRALAEILLSDALTSELGNPAVAWLAVFLLQSQAQTTEIVAWALAVTAASGLRMALRHWAPDPQADPERFVATLRVGLFIVAVTWSVGLVLLVPHFTLEGLALTAVFVAGLAATATATLSADLPGFHLFNGLLLTGFVAGAVRSEVSAPWALALLVAAFWAALGAVHRRAYVGLLDRLETSATLTLTQNRYRSLVESASDLVWRVDREGRWTYLNRAAGEVYGAEPEDLVGRVAVEMAEAEHLEADREAFMSVLAGEELTAYETVHQSLDGIPRSLSFSARPVRSLDGQVIGAQGTARDVSEQVAYRKTLERLVRQNSLIRSLINTTADQIFFKDAEGVYQGCNDAFAAFLGVTETELVGQTDLELFPPERAREYIAGDRQILEFGGPMRVEEWVEAPDGSRLLLDTVKTVYRMDDGSPAGVVGVTRDVTEKQRQAEELRDALQKAERATRMKSAFLANMSHEIRTPMNGILGMTEILLRGDLQPEQRESGELVLRSAEGLLSVLNDILDFSKIEADRMELEVAPFDLHEAVETTVRMLGVPAANRGDELLLDLDPDVPRGVVGDPVRLRQVLTNLVSNAVKFTENGEIQVRIRSELEGGSNVRILFEIRDTGIGIEPESLQRIFEEFSQADASTARRYGGTGLGLTISRRLVELMGGTLEAESQPGVGSRFFFTLPFPVDAEGSAGAIAFSTGGALDRTRVLLVDDNETNRRILRSFLEPEGATVMEAHDGPTGRAMVEASLERGTPFDLVVMDVVMPGEDGLETIEILHRSGQYPGRKTIVLTSSDRFGDPTRAQKLRVGAYVTKPIARHPFLWAVTSLLAGAPEGPAPGHEAAGRRESGPQFTCHVLLAEDNRVNQAVARAILEQAGHQVTVVGDGRAAVDTVSRLDVDVVLMDLEMPEMDGVEATAAIRALPNHADVPIIALTAHALGTERGRASAAGMNDYLTKPFRPEELLGLVRRWGESTSPGEADAPSAPVEPPHPVPRIDEFRLSMEEAGVGHAVDEALEAYQEEAPDQLATLSQALESGDLEVVQRMAHGMKSAAGSLHAQQLAEYLADLETAAREGDRSACSVLLGEVTRSQGDVLEAIARDLASPR